MDLKKLADKFRPEDLEWRVQSSGVNNNKVWCKVLVYVNNRAIMERLDSVCGVDGWKNEYIAGPCGGVLCGISVKIGDEWVTKWDGAENTNIDPVKGGLSNSMKRAGSQWGIGRYLYNFPSQMYGKVSNNGSEWGKTKCGKPFNWDAPDVPSWAMPSEPVNTEEQGALAYKLDVALTEKDLTDNEKIQIVRFYCKSKQIPLVELHELPVDHIQNFINKIEDVFEAFLSAQG